MTNHQTSHSAVPGLTMIVTLCDPRGGLAAYASASYGKAFAFTQFPLAGAGARRLEDVRSGS